MKIAINCAIELRGLSGTARAVAHMRDSIARVGVGRSVDVRPQVWLRRNRLWNASVQAHWDLRGAAHAAGDADVLLSPCNIGGSRSHQHHVAVLHDTMVLDRPELFDRGYAAYARLFFGRTAKTADVVICPSEYTADALLARWPSIATIEVLRWPVEFQDVAADRTAPASPAFLTVGATEPHKRHRLAIEAVSQLRASIGVDAKLAVVGPPGRAEEELQHLIAAVDPDSSWVSRLVGLSDVQLTDLYGSSTALLQPSVFEGYGLPVAEAASFGCPSVHSGLGSLTEIAPSGAVETDGVDGYVDRLEKLLDPTSWKTNSDMALAEARALSTERFDINLARALRPT